MIYSFEYRPDFIATSHPRCRTAEFPMLIHKQIELIYVITGSADCVIDGKTYSLSPGDVSVAFPYVSHSYKFYESEYIMLFFQPEICGDYDIYIKNSKLPEPVLRQWGDKLQSLIWSAYEAHHNKTELGSLLSKSYINAIMGEILSEYDLIKHSTEDQNTLNKLLIYCSENFSQSDVSVNSLSRAIGISPKYCSHIISSLMNTNFRQYINSLRMYEAARLIANTDQPITNIALDVGYDNQSTFNRIFLQTYGMTPKEYRLSKQKRK